MASWQSIARPNTLARTENDEQPAWAATATRALRTAPWGEQPSSAPSSSREAIPTTSIGSRVGVPWRKDEAKEETPEPLALGRKVYDSYQVEPMSDEAWSRLTAGQQRAVVANQLLYEASRSEDASAADEAYDFLGISEEARAAKPTKFATLEDITALKSSNPGPGPVKNPDSEVLASLRELSSRLGLNKGKSPFTGKQLPENTSDAAFDLDRSLPSDLQKLLGRGLSGEQEVALDNIDKNFFVNMITMDRDALLSTPGGYDSFAKEFSAATKGLPLEQLRERFRKTAQQAKSEDPTLDIEGLMEFYGLGGK